MSDLGAAELKGMSVRARRLAGRLLEVLEGEAMAVCGAALGQALALYVVSYKTRREECLADWLTMVRELIRVYGAVADRQDEQADG